MKTLNNPALKMLSALREGEEEEAYYSRSPANLYLDADPTFGDGVAERLGCALTPSSSRLFVGLPWVCLCPPCTGEPRTGQIKSDVL